MKVLSIPERFCVLLLSASVALAWRIDASGSSAPQVEHANRIPTVEEILQNNLKKVRPEPSASRVENTEKVLRISESGHALVARYRATSGGLMRIDVFSGDARVYSEGKDKMGVWEWASGESEPVTVTHDGVEALEHGIEFNLFPLAELANRGHAIEFLGMETIRDQRYFILQLTLADGFETYRLVNADTWLVEFSRDFRAFHPAIDSTNKYIETHYSQWTLVDGVRFAGHSQNIDLDSGVVIATTEVLKSNYNQPHEALDLERDYLPTVAPTVNE